MANSEANGTATPQLLAGTVKLACDTAPLLLSAVVKVIALQPTPCLSLLLSPIVMVL